MGRTSKSNNVERAYCVDEEIIRNAYVLINEYSKDITITFSCTDGTSIKTSSIDELISFPNTKSRRIKSLQITNDWGSTVRISLSWAKSLGDPNISYSLDGDDKDVVYLDKKISEIISASLSSNKFVSRLIYWTMNTTYALLVLWLILIISSFIKNILNNEDQLNSKLVDSYYPLGIILVAVSFYGKKTIEYVFPSAVFSIGKGNEVNILAEKRRSFLFITIFVSLAISLLANYIYGKISIH